MRVRMKMDVDMYYFRANGMKIGASKGTTFETADGLRIDISSIKRGMRIKIGNTYRRVTQSAMTLEEQIDLLEYKYQLLLIMFGVWTLIVLATLGIMVVK